MRRPVDSSLEGASGRTGTRSTTRTTAPEMPCTSTAWAWLQRSSEIWWSWDARAVKARRAPLLLPPPVDNNRRHLAGCGYACFIFIWLAGRVVGRTEFYSCVHAEAFTERLFTVVAVDVSDWGQWRARRSSSSPMLRRDVAIHGSRF